ncbi:site-specific DNA-methyltransferase [Tenacibaculum finnmarkense genomovar ulcerans]|uniref:site-specific DNA-methyltransferase n=1 Tax=Tenacibaculum finnmarkense TaxID=2781243 RepID=UPI00187B3FE8|nr:site-specific DNA-methyltransferase [Tenacibaculum finnmarkense]MBE7634112.1 site-specific DNA-methyltransferase [Tenacibaculum finnmarkense genomovar ulcerans]
MSIHKIQQGDNLTKSKNLVADNIDKLKELFPEIVTEGKIDFKVLQDVLGENIEEEDEYYRFTWAGKAQARREAHKPSTGTLRPVKEDSVDWNTTENVYIEGDNLEVLKLLQKSYAGKVKMIYIDPPYNTGKDFVYKDNYKDNLKNYQEVTGQVDSEGNKLSTNSDSDGRYHSNWLNMMYPRLRLARNLLKDDGVIFMSIDDNEVENLKKLGNEIFGEDNFVANIIWEKKYSPQNDAKWFSANHDHILVFAKNKEIWRPKLLERTKQQNARYKNPDNDPRGDWKSSDLSVKTYSPDYDYPIETPSGRIVNLPQGRCWMTNKVKMNELIKDNRIWFGANGDNVPSLKRFLTDVKNGITPLTIWFRKDVGDNQEGKQELLKIMPENVFQTPKVVRLLKRILHISGADDNDILLDFFSGSATTAHATMSYNIEKESNIRHISVQLPEPTDVKSEAFKSRFTTLSEIGKERIRRAGKKIAEENPEKAKNLDLGFKVFKLDSSNIKSWDGNPENLQEELFDAVSNIKIDRTEEDVLYEILLKYGLDLTLPIEEKIIEGKTVFNVGFGALFICLGDNLTNKVAEGIGAWKEELQPEICRVIFKDTGFTDVEKTNSIQTLKRFGITEIKSI